MIELIIANVYICSIDDEEGFLQKSAIYEQISIAKRYNI